ncbi:dihydroorotase [Rhabdothermincola sediminis]|uniref:dihydroorotase n=1 Tax=Rhabdothermincola sediminis TaxID=2751370 RepID=UPI001AA0273F|nr:dihydroorotase [Rhabdothermincola sediminis]
MAEAAVLVVTGGRVVDREGERPADIAVGADGRILAVDPSIEPGGAQVLDATGCVVAPGLVDLHTHLREPGREEAETVESGSRAAALGGFTAVVAMPNTEPTVDNAAVVSQVLDLGKRGLCEVFTAGAITVGREGEQLAPMGEMAALGVRLFTDDGRGVQDERLMRRALEYASGLDVTLAQHCEVESLSRGGHMHEGAWSSRLGIPGIPAQAEELMVSRDLALVELTGARMHFQHLSTAGSVELVRAAKAKGLPVTAEACPHHFTLTHAALAGYDPVFKVNPPLRTDGDVAAVKRGLGDGTIDAIATDHAPHTQETKEAPFDEAPCGMVGLETALALALTELELPIERVLALLSWQPAAIAGIADSHGGPVAVGRPANLCVIDTGASWVVDPARSASRSRNNPYAGRTLTGKVRHTVLWGEPVVVEGEAQR